MKRTNYSKQTFQSFLGLIVALGLIVFSDTVMAESFVKGAKLCEECHEEEYNVWEKTKHFTSFRMHQNLDWRADGHTVQCRESRCAPKFRRIRP